MAKGAKDRLSPEQEKFVQYAIELGNHTEAYKLAFPKSKMSDKAIYVEASNMINGTGNYKNNPKVHLRYVELNQKALKKSNKGDEKKIATASDILIFLSSVMWNINADLKDRLKAAELSGKRFGLFSEHVQINTNLPPVIIDDVRE